MSPDPVKAKAIFLKAVEQHEPSQWGAFLDEACGDSPELRREVEVLLAAHAQAGAFLENGAVAPNATIDQPITEKPGAQIGPYKLLQQIGEGGFGVVYMAEQTEPVKRRVALKIIKPGMDTRQVIGRFEAERQALAMMDHPSIARVLDAGTTEDSSRHTPCAAAVDGTRRVPTTFGRPYFVMELVKGVPITQFCDEKHLTPRQRLELFVPVCQALQHAHQKGVIHRDIKPSNVLVAEYDDQAVPKIIDFGVAKAIDQRLTEKTAFTQLGQVVGTIDYMSPEQAKLNELDVDTRSDVYSLGVLLYELLTGETPFDRERLRSAAFDELLRIIREEEPPKPSLRLSTSDTLPSIAATRQIEPKKLSTLVRGELDWIVMRALEKDRTRRYQTASSFAEDVGRYLNDEAVIACPPSTAYRFKKFARRNKAVLSTVAAVAVALLLGIAGTTWQAIRATRAFTAEREAQVRINADRARETTERTRINRSMLDTLDRLATLREEMASLSLPDSTLLAEIREHAGRAATLARNPLADAALAERVQRVLEEIREDETDRRLVASLEEARLLEAQTDLRRGAFSKDAGLPAVESAFRDYGIDATRMTPAEAARRIGSRPAPVQQAILAGLDHWLDLARRFEKDADVRDERLVWLGAVIEAVENDPWRVELRALLRQEDFETLEKIAASVDVGSQSPSTLVFLAGRLRSAGKTEPAISLLLRAQVKYPGDFWVNNALGWHLLNTSPPRYEQALRYLTAASAIRPDSPCPRLNIAHAFVKADRYPEAEEVCRELVLLAPDFARAHGKLITCLKAQGRLDEALAVCRQLIELAPDRANSHGFLGDVLLKKGEFDSAITEYRKAVDLAPDDAEHHSFLGQALRDKRQLDEALVEYRTAIKLDPDSLVDHHNVGWILTRKGDFDAATVAFQRALALDANDAATHRSLGSVLEKKGDVDAAIAEYRQALGIDRDDDWTWDALAGVLRDKGGQEAVVETLSELIEEGTATHQALRRRGKAYTALEQYPKAIEDLRAAVEFCRQLLAENGDLPNTREALGWTLRDLGRVFHQSGQPSEAESARRKAVEVFQKLATDFPGKPDYRQEVNYRFRGLSKMLKEQGKFREAEEASRQAYEVQQQLVSDYPDEHQYLQPMLRTVGNLHAEHLQLVGRLEEAVEMRQYAVDVNLKLIGEPPGKLEYRERLASAYLKLVATLREADRAEEIEQPLREAVAAQEKLVAEFPDKKPYRDMLGRCLRELGYALFAEKECQEALTCFQKGVEVAPDHPWLHHALADFRLYAPDETFRDPAQAAEHATRAVELNPGETAFHRRLAEASYHIHDWPSAAESLEKVLELGTPADIPICFQLAISHGHLGDKEKGGEWHAKGVALMEEQKPSQPQHLALRELAEQALGLSTTETIEN